MPNSLKKTMERDNGMTYVVRISKRQMTRGMRRNNVIVRTDRPRKVKGRYSTTDMMGRL